MKVYSKKMKAVSRAVKLKEKKCVTMNFSQKIHLVLCHPEAHHCCASAEGPQKFLKLTPLDCWKMIFPEHS